MSVSEEPEQSTPQVREHLYKLLVIGDFGVGKTSVIKRYTDNSFSTNYKLTIGVDFSLKTFFKDESTKISLQLWDIAGHDRFCHMTRVYYKYAIGAIIVFDLTRQSTFDSVLKWLKDVKKKVLLEDEEPVPIVLLANKCDVDNQQVDSAVLDAFCEKHHIAGWFLTSAKEGTNIEKSMDFLVSKILDLPCRDIAEDDDRDMADYAQTNGEVRISGQELMSSSKERNGTIANGRSRSSSSQQDNVKKKASCC